MSRLLTPRPIALSAALLALPMLGCGVEFDPPSEVKSLRVLAVQKDFPYARPGQTVTMRMLWHDGKGRPSQAIQRIWLGGCFNPPADLFFGCFEQFAGGVVPAVSRDEDTFSFTMPDDVLRPSPDPTQPPYGLAVVFFAACAGELGFELSPQAEFGLPLVCRDPEGQLLGSNDFVAGYSMAYAYAEIENKNPTITGLKLNGQQVAPDCVDAACLTTPSVAPDCGVTPELCFVACEDDAEPSCPAIEFQPELTLASFEADPISGTGEAMWVNYHVDRGSLKSGVRLVNDAIKGPNSDNAAELYAPKEPGPLKLWAIIRDNRGGAAWARLTIAIQ